jgi:Microtubule-binding stalk of dynein motor
MQLMAAVCKHVAPYQFLLMVTIYIMQHDVALFQAECARDLAVAEPIITAAEKALNSLDKASLGELKSFASPSAEIVAVLAACIILTAPNGKIPKVFSNFASSIQRYRLMGLHDHANMHQTAAF